MDRFTLFPPILYRPSSTTSTTPRTLVIVASNVSRNGQDNFSLITASQNGTHANSSAKFVSEGWSIALVVLTSIRLLIVLGLWLYLTRRILLSKVPFSQVWQSQLLLLSLLLSHVLLYAFVLVPTPFSCGLIRTGVGPAYAVPYSLLLLRLIVIMFGDRGYDLPQLFQLLLLFCFVAIQTALSGQWLTLIPVKTVIQNHSCGLSVGDWLKHLVYVVLLMLSGTLLAIFTRHIKSNHRDTMFLGLALGLNIPIWFIWSVVGTLVNGKPGFEDRCLAFGLFISTSIVLFVMFLPRSRQLVVVGEGGLYTEDSVSVVKPISELTVHKLYYPVYGDRRMTAAATTAPTTDTSNFHLESHWYPPLRDRPSAELAHDKSKAVKTLSRPYHLDDVICVHHHRQYQQQQHQHRCQLSEGQHKSNVRCLTPPSEEEGSTTSSNCKSPEVKVKGVEEEDEDSELDMDVGKYEPNKDAGILPYSQVVTQQLPMY